MDEEAINDYTLGEIAVINPHAWKIFDDYNLDYARYGHYNLHDACREAEISFDELYTRLQNTNLSKRDNLWLEENSLVKITDYIMNHYHVRQRQLMEDVEEILHHLLEEFGAKVALLSGLQQVVKKFHTEMLHHFDDEENRLFPTLRLADVTIGEPQPMQFGTLSRAIQQTEGDHSKVLQVIGLIEKMTQKFTVPGREEYPDIHHLYLLLKEFIADLRRHINFENYVLLPAAIRAEQVLSR